MKMILLALIAGLNLVTAQVPEAIEVFESEMVEPVETRCMDGNYHNYMVVNTVDGIDWLIENPKEYLEYDEVLQDYVPVFEEGEPVHVVFDTNGTKSIKDDKVLEVTYIAY